VAISWSPDRRFPSHVPKANPGIFTPADYTDFVDELAKLPPSTSPDSDPEVDLPQAQSVPASSLPGPPTSPSSSWSWPWSTASRWSNNSGSAAYLFKGDSSFPEGEVAPGIYRVMVQTQGQWFVLGEDVPVASNTRYTLTNLNGRWQWNQIL